MADKFVKYEDEEHSALYKNGKLVQCGDDYLVGEWLENYLGVEIRYGRAYLVGTRNSPSESLSKVEEFERGLEETEKHDEKERLKEEISKLQERLSEI